jgi:hypothetical protein
MFLDLGKTIMFSADKAEGKVFAVIGTTKNSFQKSLLENPQLTSNFVKACSLAFGLKITYQVIENVLVIVKSSKYRTNPRSWKNSSLMDLLLCQKLPLQISTENC